MTAENVDPPISDEELAEWLPKWEQIHNGSLDAEIGNVSGFVFAMAARIRELKETAHYFELADEKIHRLLAENVRLRSHSNDGPVTALRAWLDQFTHGHYTFGGSFVVPELHAVDVLAKLDSLVAESAPQTHAERVAEAKRQIIWHVNDGGIEHSFFHKGEDWSIDDEAITERAEAYVQSVEKQ